MGTNMSSNKEINVPNFEAFQACETATGIPAKVSVRKAIELGTNSALRAAYDFAGVPVPDDLAEQGRGNGRQPSAGSPPPPPATQKR